MRTGPQISRLAVVRALRDVGWTALLAFGGCLPLIGFSTVQNINRELVLDTRFRLLAVFVAVVAGGRLAYALLIAPLIARAALAPAPAAPSAVRTALARWFTPFAIGFVIAYPVIVLAITGTGGAVKWIDNFGIQILIYVMLGWGLKIVVGLAGLLDLGYAALYAVGASSHVVLHYVTLALALVTAFVTLRLRRLPVGRAWEALREDEIACRSLGINTTNTKLTAFAMGAMFAGFAGSFFAARQGFISPESFTFMESAVIVAIFVLGGMGSLIGLAIAPVIMIAGPRTLPTPPS